MFLLWAKLDHESIQNFIHYVETEKAKWKIPGTVFIGIIYDNKEETHWWESPSTPTH